MAVTLGSLVRLPLTLAARPLGVLASAVAPARAGTADEEGEPDGAPTPAGLVEELGSLLDGGVERAEDVLEDGVGLVGDMLGRHRRVWEDGDADHAQIEVRGISVPDARPLRRALRGALEQLDNVHWAEVNALTSKVAVAFDGGAGGLGALLEVVDGVEEVHGVRRQRLDEERAIAGWDCVERAEHPSDVEPIHRAVATLVGDASALGWSVVGRALRVARVPVEYAAVVSLLDNNPILRRQVERLLGRRAADLLLPLGSAAASGIAQGPLGVVVGLLHHTVELAELRSRKRVWDLREPEFYAEPRSGSIAPPDVGPRPVPVPKGPVEEWSERISLASLAAFGVTLAATRDPRRAADAFLAGMPKAARLGREGFASQLGRTLAARGVVPLDGSALRRLDRVDTVVVDSDVLVTGRWSIGAVVPLGGDEAAALRAHAERLLDPDDPASVAADAGWRLEPFDANDGALPRGAKTRARELRRDGAVPLTLEREGRVVAVVGAVTELDPGAGPVVDAIRRAGHRFLVAGTKGQVARRLQADGTVPRGARMGKAVRELQADGAVVAVVARQAKSGLAAAEVGIGLTQATGRAPWGADLLLGRRLVEAAFVIDATGVAAAVSRRSATFALAGSSLGGLVALTGPRATAGSRCLAMVNGAAGASLLWGTWSAVQLAHQPRPRHSDRTPWHALPVADVLDRLDTGPGGLARHAADQRRRVTGDGQREIGGVEPFLAELANPLNPVLGIGAGLSAAVGSMADAGLVLGLVGVNALVGGVQRLRTERAVGQLLASAGEDAVVLRGGRETTVHEDDLVRGDVICLRAGDAVPADCRVVAATGLEVDESSLTGESLPVGKSPDPSPTAAVAERSCMLYEDTTVVAGTATAVVVATGSDTEVGRSLADAGPPPPSGVEVRLEELTRRLLPVAGAAAAGVAGVGMLRRWPLREVAGTGVSLAIAAVPEGLPFVASAAQIAAARRLAQRNAVVRNPRTVEALGRVEVLCLDKTGTLTEGRMRLRAISDGITAVDAGALDDVHRAVLAAALRATGTPGDAAVTDQIDAALVAASHDVALGPGDGVGRWTPVTELPFEATRGLHAVLGRNGHGRHRLVVKGAPEQVLSACTHWRPRGRRHRLDRAAVAVVEEHVASLAARGFRVLAVAERTASRRPEIDTERVSDLELVGLVALADPVRRTAAQAVTGVRAAGVRTVMVTGDHPGTAGAIADELGMGGAVLTGTQLDGLDDDELTAVVDDVAVFARVTPDHKTRIVGAFQRRGHAVAMTGDGANDAAAIRLADVGVALGERATPAARDAADIVVFDGHVETLIDAVIEGRALWGSVREALAVLVGGNLGEIGFTAFASLFSRRAPLSPRQFLLVNLFTDLAPAAAIAIRPPARRTPEALLHEGPEASLGAALTRAMAVRGTATAAGASAAWLAARLTGGTARAGTVGLVALVGTQLGQTLLAGDARSPLVLATGLGSAAALAAVVQTPGLSHFFGCRPLGPLDWLQATTAAVAATAGSQVASRAVAGAGPPG